MADGSIDGEEARLAIREFLELEGIQGNKGIGSG
jgi:hypothetical protein